jgi:hypothetical protein
MPPRLLDLAKDAREVCWSGNLSGRRVRNYHAYHHNGLSRGRYEELDCPVHHRKMTKSVRFEDLVANNIGVLA